METNLFQAGTQVHHKMAGISHTVSDNSNAVIVDMQVNTSAGVKHQPQTVSFSHIT